MIADFSKPNKLRNVYAIISTLKASLKDFDIPIGSWEHSAQERGQSGEVSSIKEQLSMKKRDSVKLKESAENAKPIPMGHQLIS